MPVQETINWAIVGSGTIAAEFAAALRELPGHNVLAVAASSQAKADVFARRFAIPQAHDSLSALLAKTGVDIVYIATPHNRHAEHSCYCLERGVPVLCEKPLAVTPQDARRVYALAQRRGVLIMEAYMYRCHPFYMEILRCLQSGVLGAVRHIRSCFGFYLSRDPAHRVYRPELAGGAVWDVGGYPLSFCLGVAGLEVEISRIEGIIGPTGVDEYASAQLGFANGVTADIACAIHRDIGTATVVECEYGSIEMDNPWLPGGRRQGLENSFTLHRRGCEPERITVNAARNIYALEAEWAAGSIDKQQPGLPAVQHLESIRIIELQTQWLEELKG